MSDRAKQHRPAAEALRAQVAALVRQQGTVVWYDREGFYGEFVDGLAPEDVEGAVIHRYSSELGFLSLRREIEPLWAESEHVPRLLIYVPAGRSEARGALAEYEAVGAVIQPGQPPPDHNTALTEVARRGIAGLVPPAKLERILEDVREGRLTFGDLDDPNVVGDGRGALGAIFGGGTQEDLVLRFLSDPGQDDQVRKRRSATALARLLGDMLGVTFSAKEGLPELRRRVARQILMTDFLVAIGDPTPPALESFPLADGAAARQAAADLARAWRDRRGLAGSYVEAANQVEKEARLESLDLTLEQWGATESFAGAERRLQTMVGERLAERPSASLLELARQRLAGFWAGMLPEVTARWAVTVSAAALLIEADRVSQALAGKRWPAVELVRRYTEGDHPWCQLDTTHRHLERDFHNFGLDLQEHASLEALVSQARQRYSTVANDLGEAFTRAYQAAQFNLSGIPQQNGIFRDIVTPLLKDKRVAYVLVDALRFEMALDLVGILGESWPCQVRAALASVPTVTEVGMASLLPGAEAGIALSAVKGGALVSIGDRALPNRQERLKYMERQMGGPFPTANLDQLAPLQSRPLSQSLEESDFCLVTSSQEIDGLAETNPDLARRMMDDAHVQIRRAAKTLFERGFEAIVVTADHGYLFGDRLSPGDSIDPPGGKTAMLKRRVWLGKGGAESSSCMRAHLSDFGIGGDLEIAVPWGTACFKAPGAGAEYFHGGLSLPELAIPVLVLEKQPGAGPKVSGQWHWDIKLGSRSVSTRFYSVTIEGQKADLLPAEPPAVRVELWAGSTPISEMVPGGYGYDEAAKEVRLRVSPEAPNKLESAPVTLLVNEAPGVSSVSVRLIDASTGVTLAQVPDVPFGMSM